MIRSIRERLVLRSPILLITLCAFVFVACEESVSPQGPTNATTGVKAKGYDGEDYFKGIMFGIGSYAQEIPEIRDHYSMSVRGYSLQEEREVEREAAAILQLVNEYDPGFLSSFEQDIESGDHLLVQQAIQQAGFALFLALLETKEGQEVFEEMQDPDSVQQIVAQVNANGGFGELTEEDFRAALDELKFVAANGGPVNSAQGKCLALPVFFVAAVAIFIVGIATIAAALLSALYLWAAVAAQVAIAVDVAIFFTRELWFADIQPLATLQVESMIHSIATRS